MILPLAKLGTLGLGPLGHEELLRTAVDGYNRHLPELPEGIEEVLFFNEHSETRHQIVERLHAVHTAVRNQIDSLFGLDELNKGRVHHPMRQGMVKIATHKAEDLRQCGVILENVFGHLERKLPETVSEKCEVIRNQIRDLHVYGQLYRLLEGEELYISEVRKIVQDSVHSSCSLDFLRKVFGAAAQVRVRKEQQRGDQQVVRAFVKAHRASKYPGREIKWPCVNVGINYVPVPRVVDPSYDRGVNTDSQET